MNIPSFLGFIARKLSSGTGNLAVPSSLELLYYDGHGNFNLKWLNTDGPSPAFKIYVSNDNITYTIYANVDSGDTYYAGMLYSTGTYYYKATSFIGGVESEYSNIVILSCTNLGNPVATASGYVDDGYFYVTLTPNYGTMVTGGATPVYYESPAPNEWGQYGMGRHIQSGGAVPTSYQYVYVSGQVAPGYYSVGAGIKVY
jgi:hypothetical protein